MTEEEKEEKDEERKRKMRKRMKRLRKSRQLYLEQEQYRFIIILKFLSKVISYQSQINTTI